MNMELIGEIDMDGVKKLAEKLNNYDSDPEVDMYILRANLVGEGDDLTYEHLQYVKTTLIDKISDIVGNASTEDEELSDDDSDIIEDIETVLDSIDDVIGYINK